MHGISKTWWYFFLEIQFILLYVSAEHIVTFAWVCESDVQRNEKVDCLFCAVLATRVSRINMTEHYSYSEMYCNGLSWTCNVSKPSPCLILHQTSMIAEYLPALLVFPPCHTTSCCCASLTFVRFPHWKLRCCSFTCISMYYMSIQQNPQDTKYSIHVSSDCSNAGCIQIVPGQLSRW